MSDKTQENQRVVLFVRVEKKLKKAIDDETKVKKTSQAKLIHQILQQYFHEAENGKNRVGAR